MSGMETDGKLPIHMMTTTTTTLNKQIEPKKLNSNKQFVNIEKKTDMSSKNAENAFAKTRMTK